LIYLKRKVFKITPSIWGRIMNRYYKDSKITPKIGDVVSDWRKNLVVASIDLGGSGGENSVDDKFTLNNPEEFELVCRKPNPLNYC